VRTTTRAMIAALFLAVPVFALAQEPEAPAKKKTTRAAIYDAKADARAQVKAATTLARRDSRRTLVMFGFNECGWCHRLHDLFKSDPEIGGLLADEYVLVMVDIESPNADGLLAETKASLSPEELSKGVGYPFLAVLDGDGRVLTSQRTDPLEEGNHHDPAKVKAFLEKWAAPKVAASKVFEDGLAKASSEGKLVFLHFGAPTCGWCHQLDAFLAREDIAPIIGQEFVNMKVDLSRMDGADELLARYNADKSGGIPWFVFTDAKGKAIVTSDGPEGNIGYPYTSKEIGHFIAMLRKAARKLSPEQIEKIESALKVEGKKIKAAEASPAGR
jgi:thioredoxin-related protein